MPTGLTDCDRDLTDLRVHAEGVSIGIGDVGQVGVGGALGRAVTAGANLVPTPSAVPIEPQEQFEGKLTPGPCTSGPCTPRRWPNIASAELTPEKLRRRADGAGAVRDARGEQSAHGRGDLPRGFQVRDLLVQDEHVDIGRELPVLNADALES